ncbi:MAG: hypothetical protein MUF45_04965 [Spirosomaceae bacterium]|jgi:hypothetical protein|nr:hypothetical protein [Spirosomataceae bacterium]
MQKVKTLAPYTMLLGLWILLLSCFDRQDSAIPPKNDSISTACSLFSYSDTLFFKSNTINYIEPVTTGFAGTYGAYPEGLEIDPTTGDIDVNASEAGLRYKVYFVPQSTTDTCYQYVTIAGIDFMSAVYDLDSDDSLAIPSYKGLTATLPCNDDDEDEDDDEDDDEDEDDDDEDDDGCEFDDDEDDDDGDGTSDEPAAGQDVTSQGVAIDKANGKINLKKSMLNGALGANPANGASKTFRIFYRLNDNSQKALNFIDVKIHYFQNQSDIPQSLLDTIENKNREFGGFMSNLLSPNLRVKQTFRKRPPDIIIVGRYAE